MHWGEIGGEYLQKLSGLGGWDLGGDGLHCTLCHHGGDDWHEHRQHRHLAGQRERIRDERWHGLLHRQGQPVEILTNPESLSGENILPEFSLNLTLIW